MSGRMPAASETKISAIVGAVRDLFQGRSNAIGQFTLTINVASTTVTAANVGADSKILLFPRTAAAATEFGAGTLYISTIVPGAFTVVHVNSATAARTFDYVIQG